MLFVCRKSRFLTPNDRMKIEYFAKRKMPPQQIAEELGVHRSTIYRELKRGQVQQIDSDYNFYMIYSSQVAQDNADWMQTSKGALEKIGGDRRYLKALAKTIKAGSSPEDALLRVKGFDVHISKQTLYRYIAKGYLPGISYADLPQRRRKKRREIKTKVNVVAPNRRSIEQRPPHIDDRREFGHWEIDSVVGHAKGHNQSVLTITERVTNQEVVLKVKDKTAAATYKALKRLRSYFGKDWYKIFKTITCDNGSEFRVDFDSLGLTAYWCHPSCPHERGTNENTNRLVRRKLPKGKSLADVTSQQAHEIQNWINGYHRPKFAHRTSNDMFYEELAKIKLENPQKIYDFWPRE